MNKTAFFTAFAGVVFAIALAGCPSEAGQTVEGGGNILVSSDVDDINAAFAELGLDEVYLSRNLIINSGATLVIPPGKTLHLSEKKITVADKGVIIAGDVKAIDFGEWGDDDSPVIDMSENGILIADSAFIGEYAKSDGTKQVKTKNGDANVVQINATQATEIGDNKYKATVLSGGEITETDDVDYYYIINSKPSAPIILNFSDTVKAKNITVTSSVKIKKIPSSFTGSLTVIGDISDSDDAIDFGCSVYAQSAAFAENVTFKKNVSFKGTENIFSGNATFNDYAYISGLTVFKESVTIDGTDTTLSFINNVEFSKNVTVKGRVTLNVADGVKGDVSIQNLGLLALSSIKPLTAVTVGSGATLKILSTPPASITINKEGEVSYKPATGSVFSLDSARTVGTAPVSLSLNATTLNVTSTGGTLDLSGSYINLDGSDSFILGGSTAVIFSAGSIGADSYKIKGSGTLFSSLSATKFSGNEITGNSSGSSSVLTLSDDLLLDITEEKSGTLGSINVNLTDAGSITFGRAGMLYLNAGGSITTGVGLENLAHNGLIAAGSLTKTGGSLLVGSLSLNGTAAASIKAGSLGTSGSNFIAAGGSFVKVTDAISGSVARTLDNINTDGGSASIGGSILIFSN